MILIIIYKDSLSRNASTANLDCNSDLEDDICTDDVSVPSASNTHVPVHTNGVSCDCQNIDSSSNSDSEYICTPKRRCISASDSGFATGPNSSASSCSAKHSKFHKVCSNSSRLSDDEYMKTVEKFRKRVRKVRMNIRRKINADSDSN